MPSVLEHEVEGVIIRVQKGDLTQQDVDAIVSDSNSALWMGAGVSAAIKRKGGDIIEAEAVAQGPIEPGDAVIGTAGKLRSRYVIHAASMNTTLHTSPEVIAAATRSALSRARERGLQSIALPALGVGTAKFPAPEAGDIMLREIGYHIQSGSSLRHITISVMNEEVYKQFCKAFGEEEEPEPEVEVESAPEAQADAAPDGASDAAPAAEAPAEEGPAPAPVPEPTPEPAAETVAEPESEPAADADDLSQKSEAD